MSSPGELARFRSTITRRCRRFFEGRDFLEVFVPTMVPSPGMETHLRAFPVHAQEASEVDGRWLHTSPEYAIKATLSDIGADVFTFARSFRDEPPSRLHHPEFTMVEWYRVNASYKSLMTDCEALLSDVSDAAGAPPPLAAKRITVRDAFLEHVGVAPESSAPDLRSALDARGVSTGDWAWDALFTVAYSELVEPKIATTHPTFLYEFPARMAALARLSPSDRRVAERFELYVPLDARPIELANAFGELVDAAEQRTRFVSEQAERSRRGGPSYPMPEALLSGISALPETSGIALGFERLLVWLAARGPGWETRVSDWLLGEPRDATTSLA